MIEVVHPGLLTTVQDLGRTGLAAVGVPSSGALDRGSHRRANALVGNDAGDATLEVTGGAVRLRALQRHVVALAGADCPGAPMDVPIVLEPGDELALDPPRHGFRTYLAVAGGVAVPAVLGSRSWDQLSQLGPPPLRAGDVLAIGSAGSGPPSAPGVVPPRRAPDAVRLWVGPRATWFADAVGHLCAHAWRVADAVDRIGVRLDGAPLRRRSSDELPSEGLVTGAVQVPHDGRPIVMLADHPTTGGYPVVAVVDPDDVDLLAHLRPGDRLRFVPGSGSGLRIG